MASSSSPPTSPSCSPRCTPSAASTEIPPQDPSPSESAPPASPSADHAINPLPGRPNRPRGGRGSRRAANAPASPSLLVDARFFPIIGCGRWGTIASAHRLQMSLRLMVAAILVSIWTSLPTHAALIIDSGTLHASADAFSNPNYATATPPDKSLILPSTEISAEAVADGFFGTIRGYAAATVSQPANGSIAIDASTFLGAWSLNVYAHAGSQGSIYFSEPTDDTIKVTYSVSSIYGYLSRLYLYDATGTGIASLANNKLYTLQAGSYRLDWAFGGQPAAGTTGASAFHFIAASVPEPQSSVGAMLFVLLLGLLNRPNRGCVL